MPEIKKLSPYAVPAALDRAKHYRLLNEPAAAESICRDILRVEPENQEALITIVLAMSDRLASDYAVGNAKTKEYLERIKDEYFRAYYTGIVFERRAKAILKRGPEGSESNAYEMFMQALDWFEKAESLKPDGNDDAILRWNGCVRVMKANSLGPKQEAGDFLE
ncbi:MAG: hypothetical protein DWQ47_04455 [Acidobacteria bacterium]|nr:MAG: hypothetical protein DWQ32_08005 [Acidobacteriota bacterium]REK01644.1 MAG: hypothetical protein DWQ38_04440 [Acidobacteriota bacterium]REK14600.1 MAG: hypothetical protein DWQ43_13695 [Acidobacteriota bacterium]REK45315.1 MAG: hypothetical protein DWQ47_04455 [Acidobacteriota bacterium]